MSKVTQVKGQLKSTFFPIVGGSGGWLCSPGAVPKCLTLPWEVLGGWPASPRHVCFNTRSTAGPLNDKDIQLANERMKRGSTSDVIQRLVEDTASTKAWRDARAWSLPGPARNPRKEEECTGRSRRGCPRRRGGPENHMPGDRHLCLIILWGNRGSGESSEKSIQVAHLTKSCRGLTGCHQHLHIHMHTRTYRTTVG